MVLFQEFHSAQENAQALAQAVAQDLNQILQQKERVTLAVSGGKSPIAFFQALNQMDNIDWARVNITLVDERIVPNNHQDSNTKLVHDYLLQNQAQQSTFLPLIPTHFNNLDNINQVIDFSLENYKQADIVILGMGADGHTASLFPKAPQFQDGIDVNYPQPLLHTTPVTAPYERISMTLKSISQAQSIYLAIAGAEKLAVYQQAEKGENPELPISYILNLNQVNTHVFYNN